MKYIVILYLGLRHAFSWWCAGKIKDPLCVLPALNLGLKGLRQGGLIRYSYDSRRFTANDFLILIQLFRKFIPTELKPEQ